MPPQNTVTVWTVLLWCTCVGPFVALAIVVALKPLLSRPVPWYHDDQAEEMRRLGINPDERWGPVNDPELFTFDGQKIEWDEHRN